MKVLAYADQSRWASTHRAIVEMTIDELEAFTGLSQKPEIGIDVKPCQRIEISNRILSAAGAHKKTADQLRALAELIDTTVPAVNDIVNPPSTPNEGDAQ